MFPQPQQREFSFTDADFSFLAQLVTQKTGIMLGQQKRDMVYSRLARRIRQLRLPDFAQYCRLLEHDNDAELTALINAITTNLTRFFREAHHFEHLSETWLKPLIATPPEG